MQSNGKQGEIIAHLITSSHFRSSHKSHVGQNCSEKNQNHSLDLKQHQMTCDFANVRKSDHIEIGVGQISRQDQQQMNVAFDHCTLWNYGQHFWRQIPNELMRLVAHIHCTTSLTNFKLETSLA